MKGLHMQLKIKKVVAILLISASTAIFNQDYNTLNDTQLSDIMYNNYFNQKLMPEDFEYLHKTPAQIESHNANIINLYTLMKNRIPEELDKLKNHEFSQKALNLIASEQNERQVGNLSLQAKEDVKTAIQADINAIKPTFTSSNSTTTSATSAAMSTFYNNPTLESAYAAVTDPIVGITALTGVAAVALYYKYLQYIKEQTKIEEEEEEDTTISSEQQSLTN